MFANKSKHNAQPSSSRSLLTIFIATLFLYSNISLAETPTTQTDTQVNKTESLQNAEQELHTSLVLTALKLDFYNRRCRGISVAKNFNKVNRLYITKYSLTANNFIKDYINNDVRKEKASQERDFKKTLNSLGGCAKAKQKDWIKKIHDQFKTTLEQAQQSAWFPEEN
ncbi:hypothetical protein [Thiomicrorhabdus sp. Milos-T2]|uniref:hypothetical protein n=1 Tax=Thiomicrorhabdus sp. Milos-T2 TaxID=90814 RepID=UPI000493EC70|nr:hypothetical protein [Thiomicrorhabdus sp. Milos-T2]